MARPQQRLDPKETTVAWAMGKNFYCLMDDTAERGLISSCFGCPSEKALTREQWLG